MGIVPGVIRMRGWWVEATVVLGGVAATAVLTLSPSLRFAFDRPALHAMLESVAGLVAALVTFLLFGRYRRSGRRDDLLLCAALLLLATSHLVFAALPHAALDGDALPFHAWSTVPTNLLAAVVFAAAGLVGKRRARPREGRWVLGSTAAVLLVVAVVAIIFAPALPSAVVTEGSRDLPTLEGHPAAIIGQYAALVAYAFAAVSFGVRARREQDGMLRWLGIAAILAALARVNFVIYPTLFTHYVSMGDMFRLLVQCVLLLVCVREIRSYWHGYAEGAVLAERRRIARDLHDGVAQDLAFILRRAQRMGTAGHDAACAPILAAARRALEDSRRAIDALARDPDEPLDITIASATRCIAERGGARLLLDLERGIDVAPACSDALVRIACEAVANASGHGSPETIRIELRNHDGVRLRVADDGRGFDPADPHPEQGRGFGLTSMRERAQAVGGELSVASRPGHGTEVEVAVP